MSTVTDFYVDLYTALGGGGVAPWVQGALGMLVVIGLPLAVVVLVLFFCIGLPYLRRERARMFLDLLELGLSQGLGAEETVRQVAACQDRTLGRAMRWLVAGGRFGEALEMVPGFLPANISAMLTVGDRSELLPRMIPACRRALKDEVSRSRGVMHALPLVFYMMTPVLVALLVLINNVVVPRLEVIGEELAGGIPPFSAWVFDHGEWLIFLAGAAFLVGAGFLAGQVAGPRTRAVLRLALGMVPDRVDLWVPWRRLRCHRDFATTLATLLDAGLPEPRALLLAGDATGNRVMGRRAGRVLDCLKSGESLPEALRWMDATGELPWRLRNAMKGARHFTDSLAGWSEAVDARAFQQEQTSAQVLTVSVVLINGLVVGLTYAAVFMILIQTLEVMMPW